MVALSYREKHSGLGEVIGLGLQGAPISVRRPSEAERNSDVARVVVGTTPILKRRQL